MCVTPHEYPKDQVLFTPFNTEENGGSERSSTSAGFQGLEGTACFDTRAAFSCSHQQASQSLDLSLKYAPRTLVKVFHRILTQNEMES